MINYGLREGFGDDLIYGLKHQPQMVLGVYDPFARFSNKSTILIEHFFVPWRLDHADELETALRQAKLAKRFPLISLEPWPWNWQGMTAETLLQDIVDGKYDSTLRRLLLMIEEASPGRVLLRWGHEMELVDQYPWSKPNAEDYIRAYRYVVDFARRMKVNNILWVWSPAGNRQARAYFPGQDYVDYVGISIFAAKAWNLRQPSHALPFEELIREKYWVARLYRKPMIIGEVGVEGTDTEQKEWLAAMIKHLPGYRRIKAVVYFNQSQPEIVPLSIGQPNWKLGKGATTQLIEDWQNAKLQNSVQDTGEFLLAQLKPQ